MGILPTLSANLYNSNHTCHLFHIYAPQLVQIHDMKTQALVIAAPFAFTLGLLASILAVILGMDVSPAAFVQLMVEYKLVLNHLISCSNQRIHMDLCRS